MSINGIKAGDFSANVKSPTGNSNPQIKALEQKLQQLTKEAQKAAKAQDTEKAKQIAEQIQVIKRQLAELKQQELRKQEDEKPVSPKDDEQPEGFSGSGHLNKLI